MHVRERRHRPRRASSCARKCITSVRESTARDRQNKQLRSVFRRRGEPASEFLPRRALPQQLGRRRSATWRKAADHDARFHRRVRARFVEPSSAKDTRRRPGARLQSSRGRVLAGAQPVSAPQPRAKRLERREPPADLRPHGKLLGRAHAIASEFITKLRSLEG